MHILDLIMYFVTCAALWGFLALISNRQLTEEIGALAGMAIMLLYSIFYLIAFAFYPDWNWSDFNYNLGIHFQW